MVGNNWKTIVFSAFFNAQSDIFSLPTAYISSSKSRIVNILLLPYRLTFDHRSEKYLQIREVPKFIFL